MVPSHVAQLRAVGAHARVCVEVTARREHLHLSGAVELEGDQLVDHVGRFGVARGAVVLAHADEPLAARLDVAIREAEALLWASRALWRQAERLLSP